MRQAELHFRRWREVARRYGFAEWEGPPLEATELYKKKSGAEIVEQLFNFTDKGEREVALRPELTPTLARVVAAHEREFKKPLKWFSIGQFFRYEKQQRGRLREHFQLNCDIIGETDLAADIELVALCIDIMRAFGFSEKDFVVRISDREFWTDFFRDKKVPAERWDALLQAIDKSAREPREKTAEKLGDLADPVFETLKSGGKSSKLEQLVEGLRARGLADFVAIDRGYRSWACLLHRNCVRGVRSCREISGDRRRRPLRQLDRATQRRCGFDCLRLVLQWAMSFSAN